MGKQKRKKEKERLQELVRQLEAEQPVQMQQVAAVKERLGLESEKWMEGGLGKWELHKTTPFIFVHCLIPRALLSTQDAMFSAR